MAFFCRKVSINYYFKAQFDFFILHVSHISLAIKLGPTIGNKWTYVVKKAEKREIFNFADFHLKMHIFQFCYSTTEPITYIPIDICTCILLLR